MTRTRTHMIDDPVPLLLRVVVIVVGAEHVAVDVGLLRVGVVPAGVHFPPLDACDQLLKGVRQLHLGVEYREAGHHERREIPNVVHALGL